jgi:hypothetical protein
MCRATARLCIIGLAGLGCWGGGLWGAGLASVGIAAEALAPQEVARRIDEQIAARLKAENLPASPRADDAEFLRRVYLDITGRIPSYDEALAFLDSTEPDKREALIDELLARPEYGLHFATTWRDLIVGRDNDNNGVREGYSWAFVNWLADGLNKGRGWNELVYEMLTAEGEAKTNPATTFVMSNRMGVFPKPDSIVASAGQLFMGIQIRCAQCHDHPYVGEWTQDDFWGMAAFFGQLRDQGMEGNGNSRNPVYGDKPLDDEKWVKSYETRMLRAGLIPPLAGAEIAVPGPADPTETDRVVAARQFHEPRPPKPEASATPEASTASETPTSETSPPENRPLRTEFANWLTAPENKYFARAAANRLWAHFFARGLVHPVDVMQPDNAPSHPEVLALLEEQFKASGFDPRHVIRGICRSEAYQRTSRPVEGNAQDEKLLSHMAIKQLTPDQTADALTIATGGKPRGPDKNRDRATAGFFTKEPGDDPREFTHAVPQFLLLMNAKDRLRRPSVQFRLDQAKDPIDQTIEGLYVTVLSRRPSGAEREKLHAYVAGAASPNDGYADVTWMLLNSAEFMLNR